MKKYECHVTVSKPSSPKQFKDLESLAEMLKWKTSYIMNDPILGQKPYFYFTKYSTSIKKLHTEIVYLTDLLECEHCVNTKVIRAKIEQIIYDKKARVKVK